MLTITTDNGSEFALHKEIAKAPVSYTHLGQDVDGLLGISVDEVVDFRLARYVLFLLGTNQLSASLDN